MYTQSKNWTFTDFEDLDWKSIYKQDEIRYVCWGIEVCPNSKRTHNQGWIQFTTKRRLKGAQKMCRSKKLHMEPCRGDEDDNEKYCKKDGQYHTLGKYITQGQRLDLEGLKDLIDTGGDLQDVADKNIQAFCQYNRGINQYIQMAEKKRRTAWRAVEVIHLYGETGTGKTRTAMADGTPYKIQASQLSWWDGYNGESTIVIDEYDNDIPLTQLLGILDGYQLRLPIKGGFTYAAWTKVYITSNYGELHPKAKPMHQMALERRITRHTEMC